MGNRVCAHLIKDVYMLTDERGISMVKAPTATSATNSRTLSSTRKVVHARMRITNGT